MKTYEQERNALIPAAEKYADNLAGEKPRAAKADDPVLNAWTDKWNKAFHGKMNRLWREFEGAQCKMCLRPFAKRGRKKK